MFIGIAGTIPSLPNLPGQGGGGGVEVLLEYDSSSFCKVTIPNLISPTVAEPAGGTFSYTGTGTLGLVPNTGLINIAASDSGSYTITYSVDGSSSNFPIAIGNEIILSITTSPGATICTGDTATLTANASGGSGGFTYAWNTSPVQTTQSIDVTTSGNYIVTVTDSDGCSVSASQAITASTNATAIASINNDAAISFNGTDQYIEASGVTSLNGLSTMSFSLWVKAASGAQADNYSTILTIADSTTNQGQIIFSQADTANNFNFYVRTSSGYGTPATTGTGFFNGNWRHVAGTYDGANLKLYLDGTQVSSVSRTGNLITATGELYLSRSYNSLQNFFNGELDEVAVWDSALSSCDIKGIYEGSIGSNAGKAANLLDANTTIPAPVYWNRMGDS